jgi:hypothetical protein
MALRHELPGQLAVVVDLAVVHELEPAVLARERLVARLAQVDDRQAAEPERDPVAAEGALSVRAAVVELRGHARDRPRLRRTVESNDSAEPAHQALSLAGPARGRRGLAGFAADVLLVGF